MDVNSCSDKGKSYIVFSAGKGFTCFMMYIKGRIIGRAGKECLSYMNTPLPMASPSLFGEKKRLMGAGAEGEHLPKGYDRNFKIQP
jgi:hypothetical protein